MTRSFIALSVADLSAFARQLATALQDHQALHGALPSHQALLNHLARAAGYRNLQALQAAGSTQALPKLAVAAEDRPQAEPLSPAVRKALTQFDSRGRLLRWPHKFSIQQLTLWVLWMQFDGRRIYTEREVNELLKAHHTWGDHATLRRELVNAKLLARKSDCSQYRKLPARAEGEAQALMRAWRAQVAQHRSPRTPRYAGAGTVGNVGTVE